MVETRINQFMPIKARAYAIDLPLKWFKLKATGKGSVANVLCQRCNIFFVPRMELYLGLPSGFAPGTL